MGATDKRADGKGSAHLQEEFCECTGGDTVHEVEIRLITENTETPNSKYSREPYRVMICQLCGRQKSKRMNKS